MEEENKSIAAPVLTQYTCERCGFKYEKQSDYKPYLCYRCLRYMAKKMWEAATTITPPISRPIESGI